MSDEEEGAKPGVHSEGERFLRVYIGKRLMEGKLVDCMYDYSMGKPVVNGKEVGLNEPWEYVTYFNKPSRALSSILSSLAIGGIMPFIQAENGVIGQKPNGEYLFDNPKYDKLVDEWKMRTQLAMTNYAEEKRRKSIKAENKESELIETLKPWNQLYWTARPQDRSAILALIIREVTK